MVILQAIFTAIWYSEYTFQLKATALHRWTSTIDSFFPIFDEELFARRTFSCKWDHVTDG